MKTLSVSEHILYVFSTWRAWLPPRHKRLLLDWLVRQNGYLIIQAIQAIQPIHKVLSTCIKIRFVMDNYEMMSWLLIGTLLVIALFPHLNKTVAYLKSKRLSPS
jgi:hypothetical protein